MADSHVNGNESLLYILENHPVKEFPAEVEAGGGGAHGPFVGGKDGLVVLYVLRSGLFLHPFRHIGLSQAEEGFLEILVGAIEEETEGTAAGGSVVNHFRHQGLVLPEVQFVADADFAGGVHNHVPQALFPVEFPQQEHHDIGPGFFLLAVQAGGENLGVVEDKDVSLEQTVFNIPVLLVEDHQAGFVAPAGRFLRYAVGRKFKVEL